jgi:PTH1 family peptidyl-tRNA hydrolase
VRLVVGLGNPGERYAETRHNVAWQVLDVLAGRWRGREQTVPGVYTALRARVGGDEVELMKPLTFMNLSGEAVMRWQREHQGPPDDLLVVGDDVYLPVGTVRLKPRGSSGGHRGLESIEQALGGSEFARLRIGVGAAKSGAGLRDHVLEAFTDEERAAVDDAVLLAADAVQCWLAEGITSAMNRFNRRQDEEARES